MSPVVKSVIVRIMEKVTKKKTGCWIFTGYTDVDGYGQIGGPGGRKGKKVVVHRYVYWYYKLKPKGTTWKEFSESCDDLQVCHKCDNPPCCNPKHLFLGTPKDNTQDCIKKQRRVKSLGENHGRSKLTEEQVLKIYRMKGSHSSISNKFSISRACVTKIKLGVTWNWLTNG